MGDGLTIVDHPLLRHKLGLLRRRETGATDFRRILREAGMLLAYDVTRCLSLAAVAVETPVAPAETLSLSGPKLCLISILRAGDGLLQGMLDVIPTARVGHVGLCRDPETLAAVEYYYNVPDGLGERVAIVVDPMLGTGNTAVAAVSRLKRSGARDLRFVCLLAAPEGWRAFHAAHPDVPVWAAGVDERLNDRGYMVPGIGDAGDRLFGTR